MIGSQHPGPRYRTGSYIIVEDTIEYPAYFSPSVTGIEYTKIGLKANVTYRVGPGHVRGERYQGRGTLFVRMSPFPKNIR